VTTRADEIAANLGAVRARIEAACARAGRDVDDLTLTVVTKHFPASDIRVLHRLGVRHLGENRHQEAQQKAAETTDLDVTWHFVGSLQTNKAPAVASYADVVESVDRPRLVSALTRGAAGRQERLVCLVQVNLDLDGERLPGRGGAAPADVVALAEQVAAAEGLTLRGVMAVAPRDADPRPAFDALVELAQRVRSVDPAATWVSAGMSGDLEAAVEAGATHLRIGSAVLGERPPIQ
jgi:pyridoxal phosphate enzyme (YggS family)